MKSNFVFFKFYHILQHLPIFILTHIMLYAIIYLCFGTIYQKGEFMKTANETRCVCQGNNCSREHCNSKNICDTVSTELKRDFLNNLSYEYSVQGHCVKVLCDGQVCIVICLNSEAVLFVRNEHLSSAEIYNYYRASKHILLQRAKQIAAAFKHVDAKQDR